MMTSMPVLCEWTVHREASEWDFKYLEKMVLPERGARELDADDARTGRQCRVGRSLTFLYFSDRFV